MNGESFAFLVWLLAKQLYLSSLWISAHSVFLNSILLLSLARRGKTDEKVYVIEVNANSTTRKFS